MRYFLLALLALTGCGGSINVCQASQPAVDLPEPPSLDQVTMSGNASGVTVRCSQEEVNQALVWDRCTFHNVNQNVDAKMCIQISYQRGSDVIATSRVVCSGPLFPNEEKENFAAFTAKNGRDRLEFYCGSNMINCKLTTKEVVQ